MILNFMDIGGMKVPILYIHYLKKYIMIQIYLNVLHLLNIYQNILIFRYLLLVDLHGEQIGYSEVWLNHTNDYAHKHLLKLCDKMVECANLFKNTNDSLEIRCLNQMARELLLLQSSDWLFIITNGTMVEYAHKRIKDHTGRFNALYDMLKNNSIHQHYLKNLELKDDIFPEISYHIYCTD